MIEISYSFVLLSVSVFYLLLRIFCWQRQKRIFPKRELQLLLVYAALLVLIRYTFFPFFKAEGRIQPLLFDPAQVFPPRINWKPLVNLLDYPDLSEALLNVLGNSCMFIPIGLIWPFADRRLNTPSKAILGGVGISLLIEILQLPFFDRVTDVDDLLLNSLGYLLGYGLFRLLGKRKKERE